MAKIERKYMAHFLNAAKAGEEAVYERLGQDLEEYSAELSAQVETKRNILGESAVVISGYEKTGAVEPYYADADNAAEKTVRIHGFDGIAEQYLLDQDNLGTSVGSICPAETSISMQPNTVLLLLA